MMMSSRRKLQFAATLILGASLGGALLSTFAGETSTGRDVIQTNSLTADRCAGGSDVSRFVCRNGWMTFGKYAAR